MKKVIESNFGKFNSYYEPEKKRVNIVVDFCLEERELLNVIENHVQELGLSEAFLSPHGQPMFLSRNPDYDISSYETNQTYEKAEGYELIELTESLYDLYIQMTNASTFDVDNMSYVDINEVKDCVENEHARIGLIRFENDYIGSYIVKDEELESFGIDPKHQGNGHGYNALNTILSTMEGSKYLLVCSRNVKALRLYQKAGFKKTDRFVSYWYDLSF